MADGVQAAGCLKNLGHKAFATPRSDRISAGAPKRLMIRDTKAEAIVSAFVFGMATVTKAEAIVSAFVFGMATVSAHLVKWSIKTRMWRLPRGVTVMGPMVSMTHRSNAPDTSMGRIGSTGARIVAGFLCWQGRQCLQWFQMSVRILGQWNLWMARSRVRSYPNWPESASSCMASSTCLTQIFGTAMRGADVDRIWNFRISPSSMLHSAASRCFGDIPALLRLACRSLYIGPMNKSRRCALIQLVEIWKAGFSVVASSGPASLLITDSSSSSAGAMLVGASKAVVSSNSLPAEGSASLGKREIASAFPLSWHFRY